MEINIWVKKGLAQVVVSKAKVEVETTPRQQQSLGLKPWHQVPGPVEIEGAPLEMRLLGLLVKAGEKGISRDEIFDALWSRLSVKEATNVFHVTKTGLGQIIEPLGLSVEYGTDGRYRLWGNYTPRRKRAKTTVKGNFRLGTGN